VSSVAVRPDPGRLLARARTVPRSAPALLFGTALAIVLAVIGLRSGGGLSLGPTTKLEMTLDIAGGLLAALAALAAVARRMWGAVTVAFFAVLLALTAISIAWSVDASDTWLEVSRTASYVAVFGAGVVLVRIGGIWWEAVLGAVIASTTVICGYAILTKVFPGALAPDEVYARLREPYGYWNAVGLTAALGVPPTLWLGARRTGHAAVNAIAWPVTGVLLLTILLAYSRGSLLAVAVGGAFWFALVPLRLRGVAVLAGGALGALAVAGWVFGQDALSKDQIPVDVRAASGHQLGIAVIAMILLLTALGLAAGFGAARRAPSEGTRRRIGVALVVGLALVPVGGALALSLSSKGLGGSLSSGWRSLTDPNATTPANDPGRLTAIGSVRARYWNEAGKIFRAHPWTGVGAGGYATARLRYRQDTLAVRHAHGYVVQTAADLGVLGLLASLALLAAWLAAASRSTGLAAPLPASWRARLRLPAPVETWGPERIGMVTLATVVLVFGVHSFVDWTWFVPGTAVIALLCAGWVAGRGPLTEAPAQPGELRPRLRAGVRSPWRAAAAALAVALGLVAAWATWQPLRSVHAGNDALAALDGAAKDPKAIDRARDLAQTAHDRNPLSAEPYYDLAVVESVAGRKDAARAALHDAVRLQPGNPATWQRLAQFELEQADDPKAALRIIGAALYLDPRSADAAQTYLDALRRAQAKQQP